MVSYQTVQYAPRLLCIDLCGIYWNRMANCRPNRVRCNFIKHDPFDRRITIRLDRLCKVVRNRLPLSVTIAGKKHLQ